MRTLLCTDRTTRRRTALVGLALQQYDIDIAVLTESRLSESGSLTEPNSEYTFFWGGLPTGQRRMHGVCMAIKTDIAKRFQRLPCAVNERLMTLKIPTGTKNRFLHIIGVYAPTLSYDDNTKEVFYSQLDQCIRTVPKEDKLKIMGDFNARVGTDHTAWLGTLGRHGVGKCNSNGLLLLTKCAQHNLAITNTFFQMPLKNKTSWMHPRSKKWHLLDYVICRRRGLVDIKITKTIRGGNCEIDHHMILCKIRCTIKPPRPKTSAKTSKKLDVARLLQPGVATQFSEALDTALETAAPEMEHLNTEEKWCKLRNITYEIAEQKIGLLKRRQRDWFNDNIVPMNHMLEQKDTLHKIWLSNGTRLSRRNYYNYLKEMRRSTRRLKDEWFQKRAQELCTTADRNITKKFYDFTKELYGPPSRGFAPLSSKDGTTLLTEQDARMQG